MALDRETLKDGIKNLMTDMLTKEEDSIDEYADRMSLLIEDYVKSGDGKYQAGSLVAGPNPVTNPSGDPVIKMQ